MKEQINLNEITKNIEKMENPPKIEFLEHLVDIAIEFDEIYPKAIKDDLK